jgi:membrane protein implicated in regulation of membrane protease activity
MWCHGLLATPFLGLGLFFILPFQWALAFYALLVIASLLLYYKMMECRCAPVTTSADAIIGQVLTANEDGAVYWRGEWWAADPQLPNQRVRIVELRGLQVEVEPATIVPQKAI